MHTDNPRPLSAQAKGIVDGIVKQVKQCDVWRWAAARMAKHTDKLDFEFPSDDEPARDFDLFGETHAGGHDHEMHDEEDPVQFAAEGPNFHTGPAGNPAGDRLG